MSVRAYDFSHWGEALPKVSCVCATYGRPHLLGEAVESFLRQDYPGEKELVILNDHPEMPLSIPAIEGVRLINVAERFKSLGEKRNALAELATGDLLLPWDDDDISLSWRISLTVSRMRNRHYYKPSTLWWWTGKGVECHRGVMAHAMAGFSREVFQRAGGYPPINSGEDQGIEAAIGALGLFDSGALEGDSFYIYRLNHVHTYHISAHAFGGGWEECAAEVERSQPPGERGIVPGWAMDYEAIVRRHVEKRVRMLESRGDRPALSVCIAIKDRSRVPAGEGLLELFPNCVASIRRAAAATGERIELVVADFGSQDRPLDAWLEEETAGLEVNLIQVEEGFSRGRGLNLAARAATGPNLLLCDADMLVDGAAIQEGLEVLSKGEAWFPVIRNLEPDGSPGAWEVDGFGISFINRDWFLRAGGFPEFQSWGGEDNVLRDRVGELGPVARSRCEGLRHQWHPDGLRDLHYANPRRSDFQGMEEKVRGPRFLGTDGESRRLRVLHGRHRLWSGMVHLRESGVFYRPGSDVGTYEAGDGELVLRWDEWPSETLRWCETERAYLGGNDFRLEPVDPETDGPLLKKESAPAGAAASGEEKARTLDTIVVMVSHANRGFPHLNRFFYSNPGAMVHLMHSGVVDERGQRIAWRNCDRTVRKWWNEQGRSLDFRRVVFIEYDVVFAMKLADAIPDGHFVVRDVHDPAEANWYWFGEIDRLPGELRCHATGISPLAVIALSRECLEAMMAHPLAEALFEADIFCELRLPTLATACGYRPISNREAFEKLDWREVEAGPGPGIWHAVKC